MDRLTNLHDIVHSETMKTYTDAGILVYTSKITKEYQISVSTKQQFTPTPPPPQPPLTLSLTLSLPVIEWVLNMIYNLDTGPLNTALPCCYVNSAQSSVYIHIGLASKDDSFCLCTFHKSSSNCNMHFKAETDRQKQTSPMSSSAVQKAFIWQGLRSPQKTKKNTTCIVQLGSTIA